MRRPLIVGAVLGLALAVLPQAGQAATSPSVALLAPSSGELTGAAVSIRWSYAGFYRTTPIDVEVRRGTNPFVRVARVAIDDGSPGYYGSTTWSTTSADDASDWTVRIIVPTNKWVTSSVNSVVIDNTGPTVAIDNQPAEEGLPAAAVRSVTGTASDAGSGVASVAVTFTAEDGTETVVDSGCTDCSTWSVSTDGLMPGWYTVSAVGTDNRGNVGDAASVDALVIEVPEPPTVDPQPVVDTVTGIVMGIIDSVDPQPVVDTVTDIVESVDPSTLPDPTTLVPDEPPVDPSTLPDPTTLVPDEPPVDPSTLPDPTTLVPEDPPVDPSTLPDPTTLLGNEPA
jgi:hypothetical protein